MGLRLLCVLGWLVCIGLTGCNRDPKVVRDKCVASGNKYFQSGKFKEASILYRRALQLDPKYGEAHYRLGLADVQLNLLSDSVQAFRRAIDLDPENMDAPVQLASIYINVYIRSPKDNEDLLGEARHIVERMLKRDPKSYDALRLDADLASAVNDRPHAIERLVEANDAKPWQPETIFALMQQYASTGKQTQAERLGQQFLEKKKNYGRVYDLLYSFYLIDSNPVAAEAILKSKIEALPNDALARLQLAAFYFSRGRRPEMLAMFDGLRAERKTFPQVDTMIGDFYVRLGEFDSAIQSYREQEKTTPKEAAASEKRIAQVLLSQGKNEEALRILTKVHKDKPADEEVAAMRALILAHDDPKQLQPAIDELEALVAKTPGSPLLHYNLGRVYFSKGDRPSLDKARQHLETSLNVSPDFLPAKLTLARLQMARGEIRSTVDIADSILKADPGNQQARLLRATALANMSELVKARDELSAVLRSDKDSTEGRFQMARLEYTEKHYAQAEALFLQVAQAGDSRGILGLVSSKRAEGKPAEAMQILKREVAKAPDRTDFRLALVDSEYAEGRYQEVREQLEELLKKQPNSTEILLRLGDIQNRMGDRKGALESYQKAHEANPSDERSAMGLAVMLETTGQLDPAGAAYEDVLKINPNNSQALNNWAYIKANQGADLDQALGYAQRALRASPHDPNISDTLALIYIRKKLSGQAVQVLRELVTRVPDNPSFRVHLGMALFDSGDKRGAKKELELALRHKPSPAELEKIKELVAKLGA